MEATEKFAVLKASGRFWTVGAIHGEAEKLAELHRRLAAKLQDRDKLVYLGNFLGRGPHILDTVDQLLRFRIAFLARPRAHAADHIMLRGGQEEMWQKMLQIHMALDPGNVLQWMAGQGAEATMRAYGADLAEALQAVRAGPVALNRWASGLRDKMRLMDGHAALLSSLRRAAYSDDGGLLFVHAGLNPARPIAQQGDDFWWNSRGFDRIDAAYGTFRRVVRGYDRRGEGVRILPYTATVDGGCGLGGPLVAACFDLLGEMVDLIEV